MAADVSKPRVALNGVHVQRHLVAESEWDGSMEIAEEGIGKGIFVYKNKHVLN